MPLFQRIMAELLLTIKPLENPQKLLPSNPSCAQFTPRPSSSAASFPFFAYHIFVICSRGDTQSNSIPWGPSPCHPLQPQLLHHCALYALGNPLLRRWQAPLDSPSWVYSKDRLLPLGSIGRKYSPNPAPCSFMLTTLDPVYTPSGSSLSSASYSSLASLSLQKAA